MTQVLASYRSVEANFTSFQASVQKQSLAAQVRSEPAPPNLLNKQQSQLADEISISDSALQKFEEARRVEEQLRAYLNYLKGREEDKPHIIPDEQEPTAVISGRSTNISASITAGSIHEESLEISADIDDEGNLNSLTVTKTEKTVEFVHAELILEDTQFYSIIS
jgi:hypothetical protein